MSGERRGAGSKRSRPQPSCRACGHCANAKFAPREFALGRVLRLAARSPRARRPRGPRDSRPRALGREDAERGGAAWGRGCRLPKMQDGSRASSQPLLPHHGLHLSAPAQRVSGHPSGPGAAG
ncbi:hypothetical protein J1605_004482 [Eschrichtius robustus]|uniref:Uncharacterized protein n=1 Tax=Eschrichtius robustus TaxID=9764 RepID=A0AB34HFT7_ESCRO|nr:hypothetical protein J1605_004482 [Eschrichtius robustus]